MGFDQKSHYYTIHDIPPQSRIVVSLRDPVDRFESLYSLYVGNPMYQEPPMEDMAKDLRSCFDDEEWWRWGYMFLPQTRWVDSAETMKERNVTWLRTERLDRDAMDKLGIVLPSQPPLKHVKIDSHTRRLLEEFYHEDYILLDRLAA